MRNSTTYKNRIISILFSLFVITGMLFQSTGVAFAKDTHLSRSMVGSMYHGLNGRGGGDHNDGGDHRDGEGNHDGEDNHDGGGSHDDGGNHDGGDNHAGDDGGGKDCGDPKTPDPTQKTPEPTKSTPEPTTQTPVSTTTTPNPTTQTPVSTTTTPEPTTQTPVATTPVATTPVATTQTPTTTTTTTNTPPGGDPDPTEIAFTGGFFIPETGGRPIIVAGLGHSCMTYADGVICWGLNSSGQLGDDSGENQLTPVFVRDLHNVIDLTAGSHHTCALTADGEIWCWGKNGSGQVGNGTTKNQTVPVQVKGLPGSVVDFTAGNDFTCAKLENNEIWCWGNNKYGQLNDGTTTNRLTPVKALFNQSQNLISGGQTDFVSDSFGDVESWQNLQTEVVGNVSLPQFISANRFAPGGCVSTLDGSVKCWKNDYESTQVDGVNSALLVGTGFNHGCSINEDLTVSCWGDNQNGELGDGSKENSDSAVFVKNLDSVEDLAVGYRHNCVLAGDGYTAYCWGVNTYGQLGNNSTISSDIPVLVHLPKLAYK